MVKENTPQRDEAIIFNLIEGIPQIEYEIKAIGQIVFSKKTYFLYLKFLITRFCIFLNNKHTADILI